MFRYFLLKNVKCLVLLIFLGANSHAVVAQLPVLTNRPRILFTPDIKNRLLAKKNAGHPDWVKLKSDADKYVTWPVVTPWENPVNQQWANAKINYYYQGSRWSEVALPLGMAYLLTGDSTYANKLKELANAMIQAGDAPIRAGSGYPSRNIGIVAGIIYDWCYPTLTLDQRKGLIDIMKKYYAFLRKQDPNESAYQNYKNATGNYYFGHPYAAAFMGYAIAGDDMLAGDPSITSSEMIAWARQRFDGVSTGLPDLYKASDYVKQTFEGEYPTLAGRETRKPEDLGNPHRGGIHVQGWSYGSDVFSQYIDFVQLVRTATGEDLITPYQSWWIDMLKAQKHSLLPNGYHADEAGDNGTNYDIRIRKSLPLRLAFILQNTSYGGQAQSFLSDELKKGSAFGQEPVESQSWESLFYGTNQAKIHFAQPLYYSGFNEGTSLGKGNGVMPYFLMRNRWGTDGTWIAFQGSAATIDDHDHFNAGNIDINYQGEYLISSPSERNYAEHSGAANTFYFNDGGVFQSKDYRRVGGQSLYGRNEIAAATQNDSLSFIRAILTTAYNRKADDLVNIPANRQLNYFFRSFLYLRSSNVVVVYDQTSVKNPASGKPYNQHLRWHFTNNAPKPTVTGSKIRAVTSTATCNIHTLLPANASIKLVDQRNNPDAIGHESYYFNTPTWRAEVAGQASQPNTDYLTVIQPGNIKDSLGMETVYLLSLDSLMEGALVKTRGGMRSDLVFFNRQDLGYQTAITRTVLPIAGTGSLHYTVTGLEPVTTYKTTRNSASGTLVLQKDSNGNLTTDIAGVVLFTLPSTNTKTQANRLTAENLSKQSAIRVYPVPSGGRFLIESDQIVEQAIVTDSFGRIILKQSKPTQIDLSSNKAGIYILKLYTQQGIVVKKLQVEK
jgi:hypothetical protein